MDLYRISQVALLATMVKDKRFVFFLLIKYIRCCSSAFQAADKKLRHKFSFISEKISSEGYAARLQMSEVMGPALGARMQCNNPTSKDLDLSCKSSLGFGGARVTNGSKPGTCTAESSFLGRWVGLFLAV